MQKHSCFISAAYGEDLLVLQGVLDRLQVTWDWGAFTSIDQPILTSVVDGIKKAHFIIGVLHDRKPPANVFLELGMAVGLGKPLLLLKAGDVELPSELAGSSLFVTDLTDEKLLSFQIDLFLRSLEGRTTSKRTFPFAAHDTANVPDVEGFWSAMASLEKSCKSLQTGGWRATSFHALL